MIKPRWVGVLYIHPEELFDRFSMTQVRLSEVHKDEGSYNKIERELGHIPNLEELNDEYWDFSWEHRTIVKLFNVEADPTDTVERADYLMYVCLNESTGLKRNTYLEGLVPGSPEVYGGAFVFKKTRESGEGQDPSESNDLRPIARYLQSDKGAFNHTIDNKVFEERVLKNLMIGLQELFDSSDNESLECDNESLESQSD